MALVSVLVAGCPESGDDDDTRYPYEHPCPEADATAPGWLSLGTGGAASGIESSQYAFDTQRERLVIFGGSASGAIYEETWFLDPDPAAPAWTSVAGTHPIGRPGGGMAYDEYRDRIVLFSGMVWVIDAAGSHWINDTWELAPGSSSWVEVLADQSPGSPAGRQYPALGYDPSRRKVFLFGGTDPSGNYSDTWTWDGAEWTLESADSGPALFDARLVFDPDKERLLLYGGAGEGSANTEIFAWNGNRWKSVASGGPALSADPQVAWDACRARMVVTGDCSSGEVWEWSENSGWEQSVFDHPAVPTGRCYGAIGFSPEFQGVVQYGGFSNDASVPPQTAFNDAWLYRGP